MQVKSSAVLNFETQNVYRLAINVTDNGLPPLSMVKAISVQIIDVNEPPETLSLNNSKVGRKYTWKDEGWRNEKVNFINKGFLNLNLWFYETSLETIYLVHHNTIPPSLSLSFSTQWYILISSPLSVPIRLNSKLSHMISPARFQRTALLVKLLEVFFLLIQTMLWKRFRDLPMKWYQTKMAGFKS